MFGPPAKTAEGGKRMRKMFQHTKTRGNVVY